MELEKLISFRKELHQYPELSGCEKETAQRIIDFIVVNNPSNIISNLGGFGVAAVYEFSEEGPAILVRCELDALPIEEVNNFEYKSDKKGVSHKCGHDGHMTIVAGLSLWLNEQNFKRGKVILLFQPAEETGKGAYDILHSQGFNDIKPNYVFALHNLPGEHLHSIIIRDNSFTAAVQSFAINLTGKESHASEPEKGINPALAAAEMIQGLEKLNYKNELSEKFALLTPIYLNIGQKAYGISAGSGDLHYTIRTWNEDAMEELVNQIKILVEKISEKYNLFYEISWFDYFPSVENDKVCNEYIRNVAKANNVDIVEKEVPIKFGEDFGWFTKGFKGAMFGLGSGKNHPALHHAEYDFPDEIIETGIMMFQKIIEEILNE